MSESRSINVKALTRVEGEGALHIRLAGDAIEAVELNIYEPPRYFEALLRGRSVEDVPDITARICGICPVAYQMSSIHAIENALKIRCSPETRSLRRLLYCGEWIESHALHMHLLHAPDFLGCESGLEMGQSYPDELKRGLRLKKHGNQLLSVLGGRSVHPINSTVGGFYRAPSRQRLQKLIPDFEWGLQAAIEATRWVAGFEFPEFQHDYEMISLSHPDEYPMNEGEIASNKRPAISVDRFEQEFREYQVPHSTALQACRVKENSSYLVGPLARVNLNRDRLSAAAKRLADELHFETPCTNIFRSIIARGLEVVHAYEEALGILRRAPVLSPAKISYDYHSGEGCAATEAPRGLLYHRYAVDEAGLVEKTQIIPPTSQNQLQIEMDLIRFLPGVLNEDDQQTARDCERLIRSYDPCISCSTHFLKLDIERLES